MTTRRELEAKMSRLVKHVSQESPETLRGMLGAALESE